MNTPTGLFGLSSLARLVWMRLAIASMAWSWPITRVFSWSAMVSTMAISSLTIRPIGNAGPVADHRGDRVGVDHAEHHRLSPWASRIAVIAASSAASQRGLVRGVSPSSAAAARASVRAVARGLHQRPARPFRASHLAVTSSSAASGFGDLLLELGDAVAGAILARRLRARRSRSRRSSSSTSPPAVLHLAPGVACCDTATRAQAVSSRLTALSGSWRAGT